MRTSAWICPRLRYWALHQTALSEGSRGPPLFQPVHEYVETDCESFVTVVEPYLVAERDQRGEAVVGQ